MNAPRPPTAEDQLAFLNSLERLLNEGSFVSSYKFALLHAIADLCVVKGDDSGAELELSTSEIAEQFIRLYWRQVAPFVAGGHRQVLSQNRGLHEAVIVRELAVRHERYQGSLPKLQRTRSDWGDLLHMVERKVEEMPLRKLQTVGSERLAFLYENVDAGTMVRLKPGVPYCFRVFHPMLTDLIEGAWCDFVNRLNHEFLGHDVDLRSFLFGSQRG